MFSLWMPLMPPSLKNFKTKLVSSPNYLLFFFAASAHWLLSQQDLGSDFDPFLIMSRYLPSSIDSVSMVSLVSTPVSFLLLS